MTNIIKFPVKEMARGKKATALPSSKAVPVRSREERIAEWEGQKTAVYKLRERDIALLVELQYYVSMIDCRLSNLMQRIAGCYIPAEAELERDAKGYENWIRRGFETVWKKSPDELFTSDEESAKEVRHEISS
jgi:hypothetical protein